MSVVIPIAGGKGGVGKSVVSLNLATMLSKQCKRVILCDLDLGGANLHTMLGLKNNQAGFGNYIYRLENDMQNLVQVTGIPNLHFIAGDCLFPGTANLDFFMKQKIIREIKKLDCDYLILDLGGGSTHNIIDFYLTTFDGLIVITPEITSVLNAYSFLKSAVYRFCYRQFAPKSSERIILQNSILKRLEGKEYSFMQILDVIGGQFPESVQKVYAQLQKFKPRVIMNMGRDAKNVEMGLRLRSLCKNKLSIDIELIGFLPYDEFILQSIAQRQPMAMINPHTSFCAALQPVMQKVLMTGSSVQPELQEAQESFEDIVQAFYANESKLT